MKAFEYTAETASGEVISGKLEIASFQEANELLAAKGLKPLSLLEVEREQADQVRPFIYEALHQEATEQYDRPPEPAEITVDEPPVPPPLEEEGIIFDEPAQTRSTAPQVDTNSLEEQVDELLAAPDEALSLPTREKIKLFYRKLQLLEEMPNKRRYKELKQELNRLLKVARREIKAFGDRRWEELAAKDEPVVSSFADFEDIAQKRERMQEKVERKSFHDDPIDRAADEQEFVPPVRPSVRVPQGPSRVDRLLVWLQAVDEPNEADEQELLSKQQYESFWLELQRFSGALLVFYLLCAFTGYYLLRSGVTDTFLVRIYETPLFKQILVALFGLFTLLSVRVYFLPKRLKSDLLVAVLWGFYCGGRSPN